MIKDQLPSVLGVQQEPLTQQIQREVNPQAQPMGLTHDDMPESEAPAVDSPDVHGARRGGGRKGGRKGGKVMNPGSRGGKFYKTKSGGIKYGKKPSGAKKVAAKTAKKSTEKAQFTGTAKNPGTGYGKKSTISKPSKRIVRGKDGKAQFTDTTKTTPYKAKSSSSSKVAAGRKAFKERKRKAAEMRKGSRPKSPSTSGSAKRAPPKPKYRKASGVNADKPKSYNDSAKTRRMLKETKPKTAAKVRGRVESDTSVSPKIRYSQKITDKSLKAASKREKKIDKGEMARQKNTSTTMKKKGYRKNPQTGEWVKK